jgi:hypothetical protein
MKFNNVWEFLAWLIELGMYLAGVLILSALAVYYTLHMSLWQVLKFVFFG